MCSGYEWSLSTNVDEDEQIGKHNTLNLKAWIRFKIEGYYTE